MSEVKKSRKGGRTLCEILKRERACEKSIEWIRENKIYSQQKAWDLCPNGDWMQWIFICRNEEVWEKIEKIAQKLYRSNPGYTVLEFANAIRAEIPKVPKFTETRFPGEKIRGR